MERTTDVEIFNDYIGRILSKQTIQEKVKEFFIEGTKVVVDRVPYFSKGITVRIHFKEAYVTSKVFHEVRIRAVLMDSLGTQDFWELLDPIYVFGGKDSEWSFTKKGLEEAINGGKYFFEDESAEIALFNKNQLKSVKLKLEEVKKAFNSGLPIEMDGVKIIHNIHHENKVYDE